VKREECVKGTDGERFNDAGNREEWKKREERAKSEDNVKMDVGRRIPKQKAV
jgi:hypothetical protein